MTSTDLYLNELVYKSRGNLLEMLEDRGFNVGELKNYDKAEMMSLLERHQQNKFEGTTTLSSLDIKLSMPNAGPTIIVKYRLDDKFKKTESLIKQITGLFTDHNLNKETDTVIILNINRVLMRPGVKDDPQVNFINSSVLKGMFVQIFGLENFLINVSKHMFVPKHKIMTPTEVKELMETYNISLKHLPEILREDPQAKYIGLRPKQVVKIDSYNSTTGVGIYYRICVKEQSRDS
jgi:DNA-directed RNA polymerase I, II, and III subunit RPABC1